MKLTSHNRSVPALCLAPADAGDTQGPSIQSLNPPPRSWVCMSTSATLLGHAVLSLCQHPEFHVVCRQVPPAGPLPSLNAGRFVLSTSFR